MLFGRVPPVQKFFNGDDSYKYIYIPTQLKRPSLKGSSHAEHICRSNGVQVTKHEQKSTIINHTNTFSGRTPLKNCKIKFFFR